MKRTLMAVAILLCSYAGMAQADSGFGIKAGLNYNGNGDYFESVGDAAQDPDKNVGYHLGFWGKIGNRIYVRPELVYSATKSDYDNDEFKMKKLDLPVLVGAKVIGPVHVFAGPSFQYILDTEFEGITIDDVDNDFTVGMNIGAGVNIGRLGVDLRYERGFSDNEATFINNNITTLPTSRVDTRPDQLILSFSLKL
ncbi:porin family protein [Flavobacterium sp. ASW18X]|uniref:porin family protein n=1 Tax=Flavobacterium sp. ASW18X TaxID=2572595 RepID=UPI0010ADCEEB|nr:porin family protein [Flavobacterium sp. ASW18X]TKD56536.1 PorT family protein [Flavobacterium sp. ASW18X]